MKIAVLGLGYVGFTAACCMASQGHEIVGVDVSAGKVADINAGKAPFAEPGVEELLVKALEAGLISARADIASALTDAEMAIVCVGTPSGPDGGHDMHYIADVSRQIALTVDSQRATPLTVVYRSTIRPGTIDGLIRPIFAAQLGEAANRVIEIVYNPEFLREATAVRDYFAPPKIVVGTHDGQPCERLDKLYARIPAERFIVRYREAETTKFVDNTWHALKVAFGNEIGRICLSMNIDTADVYRIFVADTKLNISPHYLRPGAPFGGSCLPKDVRALQRISADCGANTHLIDALLRSNDAHKHKMFELASADLAPGARVLLVGLAFKADTDDLRESPNVDLARRLLEAGYDVAIYDPAVKARHLVGANLGYVYTRIPQLDRVLVARTEAETGEFARAIVCNATARKLDLTRHPVLDISRI